MKSIKEATDETTSIHVERGNDNDCLFVSRSYLKNTLDGIFKSGVEFAQRWIPIEEELPEFTTGINHNAVNVKFETSWGTRESTAVLEPITRHRGEDSPVDKRWFVYPSVGHELKSVTHWRPIERT